MAGRDTRTVKILYTSLSECSERELIVNHLILSLSPTPSPSLPLSLPLSLSLSLPPPLPLPPSLSLPPSPSHINQYSSGVDPRLLSDAVFDLPATYHIKQTNTLKETFRPLARAAEVMKKVDLSQKVAIVTGGNSGLGEREGGGRRGKGEREGEERERGREGGKEGGRKEGKEGRVGEREGEGWRKGRREEGREEGGMVRAGGWLSGWFDLSHEVTICPHGVRGGSNSPLGISTPV